MGIVFAYHATSLVARANFCFYVDFSLHGMDTTQCRTRIMQHSSQAIPGDIWWYADMITFVSDTTVLHNTEWFLTNAYIQDSYLGFHVRERPFLDGYNITPAAAKYWKEPFYSQRLVHYGNCWGKVCNFSVRRNVTPVHSPLEYDWSRCGRVHYAAGRWWWEHPQTRSGWSLGDSCVCGPTRWSVPRHFPGGATGGMKQFYNSKTNWNESCIVTQFKVPPFWSCISVRIPQFVEILNKLCWHHQRWWHWASPTY